MRLIAYGDGSSSRAKAPKTRSVPSNAPHCPQNRRSPPGMAPTTPQTGYAHLSPYAKPYTEGMHLSPGAWIALVAGTVALLVLALFHAWATTPLILVLIVALAVARLVP